MSDESVTIAISRMAIGTGLLPGYSGGRTSESSSPPRWQRLIVALPTFSIAAARLRASRGRRFNPFRRSFSHCLSASALTGLNSYGSYIRTMGLRLLLFFAMAQLLECGRQVQVDSSRHRA